MAVLTQEPGNLAAALAERDADWIYLRFVPTAEQVAKIHRAGKRVFLSGPKVAGYEPGAWRSALEAGVDAMLTDYPIECRQSWRKGAAAKQ